MLTMAIKMEMCDEKKKCSVKMLSKNKKAEFVINVAAVAVVVVVFCFAFFCIFEFMAF